MEKKKQNIIGKLIMSLGEVALGVLLLVNPIGFTTGILIAVGVLLAVAGLGWIIGYFRADPLTAQLGQGLVKGICAMIAGLFCIFRSEWFIATFPLLTIVYGIIVLVTGVVRIQWAADMLRMKFGRWYIAAAGAALSIVLAAVILINPFETTAVIWTFIAVSLIVEAVADFIVLIFLNR
ncbi:MAG: DUF308 domain-containing protein [Bacteroides sp.]|nr:DUF308 domain-containing protein [Bacteroides sp.]